ncbi:MAG: translation initiation factor IF-2, partial [Rhodobacteraceae bacterium]|nr:translation initiation factor IF-2 [Paracoccaceae bacterium]
MDGKTLKANPNAPGYRTRHVQKGGIVGGPGQRVVVSNRDTTFKPRAPVKPRPVISPPKSGPSERPAPAGKTLSEAEARRLRELVRNQQKKLDASAERNRQEEEAAAVRRRREEEEQFRAAEAAKTRDAAERREQEDAVEREALEAEQKRTRDIKRAEAIKEAVNKLRDADQMHEDKGRGDGRVGGKAKNRRNRDGEMEQTRRRPSYGVRRDSKKINVNKALEEEHQRSHAAFRRQQQKRRKAAEENPVVREKVIRDVQLPETIVVQELANRMAERVSEVVKALMEAGVAATQNQSIDADTAEIIIQDFGHNVIRVAESDVEHAIETAEDRVEDMQPRPPVVTVMGHVDHGKTSLLDRIRNSKTAAGEAGGITQHIGAYQVEAGKGQTITFIDTPGHAAFSEMRARGANVTDIVILVVAADDSVMPQTIEAINHSRAAGVPMIVAINKCDRPDADPDRVRETLLRHEVVVEKYSGDVVDVEVSALKGDGIDELLDMVALQAELLDLKANPGRAAEGTVVEARLDVGRGPVATVLVQKGVLRKGDVFVAGEQWGRVRALINDRDEQVKSATLSMPVEVLGLNAPPLAGDILNVVESESQAREISQYRQKLSKSKKSTAGALANLESIMRIQDGVEQTVTKDLSVVVKTDVQGSAEAITQALAGIGNEEVQVRVLHAGVGAITETDISLA